MLIRHCDQCNLMFEKNQIYIQITLETDAKITDQVVSGLPLSITGEFCSIGCAFDNFKFFRPPEPKNSPPIAL